jgi:hypothetical protein
VHGGFENDVSIDSAKVNIDLQPWPCVDRSYRRERYKRCNVLNRMYIGLPDSRNPRGFAERLIPTFIIFYSIAAAKSYFSSFSK